MCAHLSNKNYEFRFRTGSGFVSGLCSSAFTYTLHFGKDLALFRDPVRFPLCVGLLEPFLLYLYNSVICFCFDTGPGGGA